VTRVAILAAATVLTGLSAGLFAAFSYAVMPGLRRTSDDVFVQAMRAVNRAILNPVFGVVFGGALLLAVAAVVTGWGGPEGPWAVAGLVFYLATVVVTLAANVPRNNAIEGGSGDAEALRAAFERGWVRWNHVRSALSTAAFAALVVALLRA
jgi:uncharacterized membrane protein